MADDQKGAPTAPEHADWATKATTTVESFVELVRDKSLRPALTALKLLFIGLVVTALSTTILVLGVVGVVRLLTADAFGGRVWASDVVVGGLLTLAGAGLFGLSRRTMKADGHV